MVGLVLAICTAACSQGVAGPAGDDLEPASVELEYYDFQLIAGTSDEIQATVKNRHGKPLPDAAVRWSSGDHTIASVEESAIGRQRARVKGEAKASTRLTAAAGGKTGVANLTVVDSSAVQGIAVTVPSLSNLEIVIGQETQIEATGLSKDGQIILGASYSWSSSNPEIVEVSPQGMLEARSAGQATITATYMDVREELQLSVRPQQSSSIPAFPPAEAEGGGIVPSAEGYGALALNRCRSLPLVIHRVTNTASDGPGSYSDVITNRLSNSSYDIVLFDTGGTIAYRQAPTIQKSCLYIAGQTAPGGGIQLRRAEGSTSTKGLFQIARRGNISNVVVRYLRIRPGIDAGRAFTVQSGTNIVLDHISAEFGSSKSEFFTHNVEERAEPLRNVTLQWSMIAATLARQAGSSRGGSLGLLVSGAENGGAPLEGVSIHHNLFAHNSHRNPRVGHPARSVEIAGNTVYNWGARVGLTTHDVSVDYIGNYYKKGPGSGTRVLLHQLTLNHPQRLPGSDPEFLFLSGNELHPGWAESAQDQYSLIEWNYYDVHNYEEPETQTWEPASEHMGSFENSRQTSPAIPVSLGSAAEAHQNVLSEVGANRRLTCEGKWVDARDELDARLISDVVSGKGPSRDEEKDEPEDFGGYPGLGTGIGCVDTDGDGMPDAFETRYGLDPERRDGGFDDDGDGYLNVEEYLNGTIPR